MTAFPTNLFDNIDITDDNCFSGWDTSNNNPDSLPFQKHQLVKIVPPTPSAYARGVLRSNRSYEPWEDNKSSNSHSISTDRNRYPSKGPVQVKFRTKSNIKSKNKLSPIKKKKASKKKRKKNGNDTYTQSIDTDIATDIAHKENNPKTINSVAKSSPTSQHKRRKRVRSKSTKAKPIKLSKLHHDTSELPNDIDRYIHGKHHMIRDILRNYTGNQLNVN